MKRLPVSWSGDVERMVEENTVLRGIVGSTVHGLSIELAETGRLTLPMKEPERSHIVDVRVGKHTQKEVLDEARGLEKRLLDLRDAKVLPPPDREAVERFVIDTYMTRHGR